MLAGKIILIAVFTVACQPKTYEKACHSPLPSWRGESDPRDPHGVMLELIIEADGNLRQGQRKLTDAELSNELQAWSTLNPAPQVALNPALTAPCDRVRRVRSIMETSKLCQNENHLKCFEGTTSHIGL